MLVHTQRGPDSGGLIVSGRRPTARLLVTPETADAVDTALIDAMASVRRRISKTDFADTLIKVGLAHMDEVAAMLREVTPDE
ncbi:hypothetical protein [Microtetraspora malaysiensis]|uniref:hypothetical protein n=1 Tax=Microtetraspora malaysiensis TaxID=161358 RepID=UPI003D9409BA